jgi:DNA polymerase III gamma/tau subunit
MRKRLEQQAQALSRSQIIKMIRSFQNAFQELEGSGQPRRLALELALMESLQATTNLADDVPAVKVQRRGGWFRGGAGD